MNDETLRAADPEAWAAAQVEAVARDLDAKPRRERRASARSRGLFFVWRLGGEVAGPKHVCAERGCHSGTGRSCKACQKAQKAEAPVPCCFAKGCTLDGEVRGEWWALWWDAEGGRHREKAGTKAAALDLYRRRKTEVRQAVKFPESLRRRDERLKDLVADYVEAVRASQAKTADVIDRRLKAVVDLMGNPPAKGVKPEDLERLKAKLATGTRTRKNEKDEAVPIRRKPASVNRFLQDLKAVFCRAVAAGKLDRSPFLGVDLLTENNKRARELSAEEETKLFEAIPADPPALRPYFRFLLDTGARAGEACALLWQNILWADGVAELPETKAGQKQYLVLSRAALDTLRGLPRLGAHAFCWPSGRPFAVAEATKAFLRAARAAGIGNLRQHDLRHAFAVRRLRGGANLVEVSALLRHASTRMSERYLHVTRADLRAAVEMGQPRPARPEGNGGLDGPHEIVDNVHR